MKQYINFHAHSTSSLLDGMSKFAGYAEKAKADGSPGMCFTEHGNLHGLLYAYQAAEKVGLKYFPGLEAYQARKTRFDVDEEERASGGKNEWGQHGPYHMGVVAYNNVGYQNLLKLSTRSFQEGFYVKPRIDHELLQDHHEGLVLLSGCLSGEVQQALMRDDFQFALDTAAKLQSIVGRENYFIEIQNHHIPEELANHQHLIAIAEQIKAPIIATCDCHYTLKEHAHSHDVMLCINTKARIDTPDRFKFSGDHFYLKSYDEMAQLFPEKWLDNTMLIYDKHDFKLSFDEFHIPNFVVPQGMTQEKLFIQNVREGAVKRFGQVDDTTQERLDYESKVILDMGLPNYFLIVADIVDYAHKNKIMTGAGRGSAAGSLVAFCLGITQVNPLDHDLPFERFLVPGRKGLPDIDLDFDDRYREEVMEYARMKYGYDHTAQICNFSEIGAKAAVKDVARVLNYDFAMGTKINNAMPPAVFGVTKTLEECLQTDEFRTLYETDSDVHTIIDTARPFEGLWRQTGVHAAGLVISDKPLVEYIPLMQKGKGKPIITQWDMDLVDQIKLLKVDFLGLRNLSIIDMAFEITKITQDYFVEENDRYILVQQADKAVYEALGRGENVGVFQMESPGIRQLMIGMKPENINDISALLALYRPGPMGSNVHNEYIERKHGRRPIEYLHPTLKPILSETYGLLLYQEQILRIAREIAGFTVPEADDLRKIVGKKIVAKMPGMRKSFVEGCISYGKLPSDAANRLFSEIEHHASYSFSKNHAMAYAYTSYLTSFLRTFYSVEFMTAALTSASGKEDRLRLYLNECKRMDFAVTPPSINHSGSEFRVMDQGTIAYGFQAVKGVGEVLAKLLQDESQDRNYVSLHDFLRRSNGDLLSRDTINHFVNAGCFDELLMDEEIPQPDLTRSQKMFMLQAEMAELGVFLTDHPFNDVQDLIAGKYTHTTKQLKEGIAGERVKVAGVVINSEKKITKAGKRMYKVIIDDLDGVIEITIPPKLSLDLPDPPFEKGNIIIADGKLDRFGDDENAAATVMCFSIEKIADDHIVGGKPIILKLDNKPTFEQLDRLNAIIEGTKGNVPVYLEFRDGTLGIKMKFNSLTSKEVEQTLIQLVEVSK
jgi:DNA polymerase-3 subunit alpha